MAAPRPGRRRRTSARLTSATACGSTGSPRQARGESLYQARPRSTKPDPLPEFAVFEQRTYATCDWPPPPGGFPDGYRAITVTTVDGPGEFEATGTNYADRVESRCQVLELDFIFGSMGAFEHLPPIRGRPGQTLHSNGEAWSPGAFGEGEDATLLLLSGARRARRASQRKERPRRRSLRLLRRRRPAAPPP